MCLLQGNRSWYANATDHAGTWRWPAYAVYFHRCSSWRRLLTCPLRPTPGIWGLSVQENCGIRSCSADTAVDVPVVQGVAWGFLLEAFSHSANCAEDWRDPTGVVLGHG